MKKNTTRDIEALAWGLTIGEGNSDETVNYGALQVALGREPTFEERQMFREEWMKCIQCIEQP